MAEETAYTIRVHPLEEGGYRVTCDEVPGAVTQGHDVREALALMAHAMRWGIKIEAAYQSLRQAEDAAENPNPQRGGVDE